MRYLFVEETLVVSLALVGKHPMSDRLVVQGSFIHALVARPQEASQL